MKPLIAVTPLFDQKQNHQYMNSEYFPAILDNGGIPVLLPIEASESTWDEYLDRVDGILFTGGQDVNPVLYKQTPMETTLYICPERDALEYGLCKKAIEKNKVILGICRGEQLINVACGGTLYQDLPTYHPSSIGHRQPPPTDKPSHDVKVVEGSPLHLLTNKTRIAVNSTHHQGIDKLGKGLVAMAFATDDLTEGVYMPDKKFVWAIQWHPERMYKKHSEAAAIFKEFIRNAGSK